MLKLFSLLKVKNHILAFIIGQIQIRQRGEGIALHAPSHGLQEVYFDLNALKVIQQI